MNIDTVAPAPTNPARPLLGAEGLPAPSPLVPPELGLGGQNELPLMPESEWLSWEAMMNAGFLTREERRWQMLRKDLPLWQKETDGRLALGDRLNGA